MTTVVEVVIRIVVLAAVVLFAIWDIRRRHRAALEQRFGPEYRRQVQTRGERDAVAHLSEVADRRDQLTIRPLEPAARDRYTRRWEAVQAEFVNQPGPALDEADRLVTEVMRDRGYPVEDFSERAELVAADYPQVVASYRAAHAARQSDTYTEGLRQAFVHYRALFDELVLGQ